MRDWKKATTIESVGMKKKLSCAGSLIKRGVCDTAFVCTSGSLQEDRDTEVSPHGSRREFRVFPVVSLPRKKGVHGAVHARRVSPAQRSLSISIQNTPPGQPQDAHACHRSSPTDRLIRTTTLPLPFFFDISSLENVGTISHSFMSLRQEVFLF